mmetsp:Transcript_23205/g.59273  ORF Transcript_23205/g.59273 Transcript_23205/m.59273 type:complete len:277 (-) Transcript_23205:1313-2143(-)
MASYGALSSAVAAFHRSPISLPTSPNLMPGFSSLTLSRSALEKYMKAEMAPLGALGSFFLRPRFLGPPSSPSSPPALSFLGFFSFFFLGFSSSSSSSSSSSASSSGSLRFLSFLPLALPLSSTSPTSMPSSGTISASSSLPPSSRSPSLDSSSEPSAPAWKSSSSSSVSSMSPPSPTRRSPGSSSRSPKSPMAGRPGADGPACASRSRSTRSFLARKKSSSTCHSLRWMPRNWCSALFLVRTTRSNVLELTAPPPRRVSSTLSTSSKGMSMGGLCT